MSADRTPRTPSGLRNRGRGFWRRIVAGYDLSEVELELLRECCHMLDECDRLRAAIATDGVTVTGSTGQPRTHPAHAELRHQRATLARLLAQLELPDEDGATLPSLASVKASRAAATRWRAHNAAKAAHG